MAAALRRQRPYKFDPIDAEQLFNEAAPRGSDAIN
jgi:hypothetical protein